MDFSAAPYAGGHLGPGEIYCFTIKAIFVAKHYQTLLYGYNSMHALIGC